jgi:hypothetical protein
VNKAKYFQIIPLILISVIGVSMVATASTPSRYVNGCLDKETHVLFVKPACSVDEFPVSLPLDLAFSEAPAFTPSPSWTTTSSPTPSTQPSQAPTHSSPPRPTSPEPNEAVEVAFKKQFVCGESGKSLCKVGEVGPGGGTIFFVDYNQENFAFDYLEAAPDVCVSRVLLTDFANNNIEAARTMKARRIGFGEANTEVLARAVKAGPAYYASTLGESNSSATEQCRRKLKKSSIQASDWFLPSLSETAELLKGVRYYSSVMLAYTNFVSSSVAGRNEEQCTTNFRDPLWYCFLAVDGTYLATQVIQPTWEPQRFATWPIRAF